MTHYMTETGRELSTPLAIVPKAYHGMMTYMRNMAEVEFFTLAGSHDLAVVAVAPEAWDAALEELEGADEPITLRDFRTVYTPTDEEVVRALRGPQGYPGPMGAMGAPGQSGDTEALQGRVSALEATMSAFMAGIVSATDTKKEG